MKEKVISKSAQETINFAANFASKLSSGIIIALDGDLGSGKTTFTKGLAKGLGIKEHITSPTFTIIQEYPFKNNRMRGIFYHIDLYRINSPEDAYSLGIDEILNNPDGIKVIEWPDKLGYENFPQNYIKISFQSTMEDDIREISIESNS
ncbi:MAG TPA: tRNA (adenosine(37)-N6)-threonylcarbamoyltransferase complex ATPase subunit type 1 TsaE [Victivallales bacterium]|nr:tRNA (adenosine(37)-N6)-threonylcarbamoyltransferase complex ATPase subunit type 1 TsaE [Victivallales bacterium]HPO89579.1 tRNA (adenosine(37)-N6)-threonylcarbamoyltransferase complex ATPase subunit type 1 TsaE [Victivallales bacterium]HRR06135.1 tRNA (adenosine(37)-N6)-threonylcarbamoyltransferase complex ATPase subunit type 1 TsaE [Victivallales bacterium]HRR29519.1 tRNA (adenosine(37)-N6)-threonylcarbamoyltransferase complex ATPase subunit type 1 TsaE [Victivallales bacterium]HRU01502.1 